MRKWLSGGVSPCQGEGRGFESRLALVKNKNRSNDRFLFFVSASAYEPIRSVLVRSLACRLGRRLARSTGRCAFSPAGSVSPRTNVPRTLWDVLRFCTSRDDKRKRSRPRGSKSSSFHCGLSQDRHPPDVVGRFAPVGALPRVFVSLRSVQSQGPLDLVPPPDLVRSRLPARSALLPAGSVSPRTNIHRMSWDVLRCGFVGQ